MENVFQLCLNNYVCKNSLLLCVLQQYNEKKVKYIIYKYIVVIVNI